MWRYFIFKSNQNFYFFKLSELLHDLPQSTYPMATADVAPGYNYPWLGITALQYNKHIGIFQLRSDLKTWKMTKTGDTRCYCACAEMISWFISQQTENKSRTFLVINYKNAEVTCFFLPFCIIKLKISRFSDYSFHSSNLSHDLLFQ